MKKFAIITLILTIISGSVGCTNKKVEQPSIDKNQPQSSDQSSPQQNTPKNDSNSIEKAVEENKDDIKDLYEDLREELIKQKNNFDKEHWEEFSREFNNEKEKIKNVVKDNYLNEAVRHLDELYIEYDTAIKEQKDINLERIESVKNKLEEIINK